MADHDGTGPDWPQDGEPSADDEQHRRETSAPDERRPTTGTSWSTDDWDADAWELIEDPGGAPQPSPRGSRRHSSHTDDGDDATRAAATRLLDLDRLEETTPAEASSPDANSAWAHRVARVPSGAWSAPTRRGTARTSASSWPSATSARPEPAEPAPTAEASSTEPEMTAPDLDVEPERRRHDALDEVETRSRGRVSEVIELGLSDVLESISASDVLELGDLDASARTSGSGDEIEELDSELLVAIESEDAPVRGSAARVARARPLPAATAAALQARSDEVLPTRIYQSRDEPVISDLAGADPVGVAVPPTPVAVDPEPARRANIRDAVARLGAMLDRVSSASALSTLGRYTRILVDELIAELRAAPTPDGTRVHELAEMLVDATRGSSVRDEEPLDEHLVSELEAVAAVLDPSLNAAHHAMLAAAWRRRALGDVARTAYRECLRRFAAHLAERVEAQPALGAALAAAWSELAMLDEVEAGVAPAVLDRTLRQAVRVADGYALPVLMRVRSAVQRATSTRAPDDERRVHDVLADLVRLSSSPFQSVAALEHLRRVWRAGASRQTLVELAHEHLAHTDRDGAYPYALQLVAWDIGDHELEIEVTRSRITALVAAGKRASLHGEDRRHRRTLKRRIVGLFLRLHALYKATGRPAEAAQALEDGLKIAPRSLIALRAARQQAERAGDWARVDALLQRELEQLSEPTHRAALCHRRARLAVERFDDAGGARERLLEALEASPSYVPPAVELGRAFLQAHHYEPLYELWSSLCHSDAAPSLGWSTDTLDHRRGELLENLLDEPSAAFDAYRSALAASPDDAFLLEGATRTGYATDRYGELSDLLLRASMASSDRLRQAAFALQAARLRQREVGEPGGAIEAWLRYLEIDPTDLDGLRALVGLYRRAGLQREALALLEQLVEIESEPGELRAQREWLGYLVAQADDIEPERARQALDALVANTPDSVTAQVLLRSTLLEARDWHGLETLCQELATDGEVSRRRDLLVQAALVARGQLNDNARARRHLEQARALDPTSAPTLDLLEEIYAELGDDEALVELLADRARAIGGAARAELLAQAGTLAIDVLDDPARASELFTDALEADPGHAIAWSGLMSILQAHGAWAELERQIETRLTRCELDDATRAALLREQAFVQRTLLGQQAQAGATLRALLEIVPDDLVGLQALCELCEARGDLHGALEMHGRLADVVVDPADRIEHLRAQCRLHLELHGTLPWTRIERILDLAPQHPDLARFLASVEVGRDDRPQLIALLSRLDAPRFGADAELASLRLAGLLERAGRLDEARTRFAALATASPDLLPARLGLLRVLDALGEPIAAGDTCLALADEVDEGSLRLPLLRAAAQRFATAGALDAMAQAWEEVLGDDPDDAEAFEALRAHYQQTGDVAGLGRLLAGRMDEASVATRIEMLRQMTSLSQVEPGNAAYRAALEDLATLAPRDLETQRRLAAYDELEGEATVAAARWERVLDLTREPRTRRHVALHAARLWLEHGQRPDQAIALCRELIAEGDDDNEPLRLMARAQGAAGRVADAISSWEQLFSRSSSTAGRVEAGLALGRLYRDGRGDRAEAARWFVAVVELDPTCEAATESLLALGRHRDPGAATGRPMHTPPPPPADGGVDATRIDRTPPTAPPPAAIPITGAQLDKAIGAQLEALARERWAIARYEQLARLMLLRDPRDPRLTLVCTLLRHFDRLDHELADHLERAEQRWTRDTSTGHALGARDYPRLLLHPDCRGAFHELYARVGEVLGRVVGPSLDEVTRGMGTPIGIDDPDGIAATVQGHAWLLGTQAPALLLHGGDTDALEIVFDPEPTLVVGRCVVGRGALAAESRVQAFRLGWALEGLRDAKAVATRLGAARIAAILGAALGELFPDLSLRLVASRDLEASGDAHDTGRELARALPRRKRRELRRLAEQTAAAHHDVSRWCRGLEHTRARAALVDSLDLGAACQILCPEHLECSGRAETLAALMRVDTLTDLLAFAVSDELVELLGTDT